MRAPRRRVISCFVPICAAALALSPAAAQQAPSSQPLRVIVAFPAGGFADNVARLVADNQRTLPAATICALYKSRWQVELFFKWIKQHLRIKRFFGTSMNAVKTQIWIAVSVYVLVAIVKKRLGLDALLYTLLQILSLTLFEKKIGRAKV